jgi:hypothetical protein
LHLRNLHPGALENPQSTGSASYSEITAGEDAPKLFVRSQNGRFGLFLHETGLGRGLIQKYATGMEKVAAADPEFAAKFGTKFHGDMPEKLEHGQLADRREWFGGVDRDKRRRSSIANSWSIRY